MSPPQSSSSAVSRRSFITGASLAVPLVAAGAAGASWASPSPTPLATVTLGPSTYAHPGLVHTLADVEVTSLNVAGSAQPWLGGWNRLVANGRSNSGWQPRPVETVIRGGDGQNYGPLFTDIHAAYQNALRWRISGEAAHGAAAVRILNAWSGMLTTVTGNADRFLAAGIYGYQFANAAELVRDHPDFEFERFRGMLLNVFHPMNEHFLTNHNGAVITNYWANWDLCNMASIIAIGIFADRDDLVDRAVTYFQSGAGNGSLPHAVPFVYEDEGLAQWQESGRDQAHSMMGIGLMGAFCEMAWNQGIDCYGHDNNRFLKAAEYVAKYNLGNDVPFTPYTWQSGPWTTASHAGWHTQTVPSEGARGQGRPVWDQVLGHYSGRKGLDTPWVSQIAATLRPDGGGGDYGPNSGGYDALGFGTLMQYPAQTGRRVSRLQSFNFPDRYVRHTGSTVRLDPSTSPVKDSQFRVVPGLASQADGRISFESVDMPGYFLRHWNYTFSLVQNDDSAVFKADATFLPVTGLGHSNLTSFRSHNYPDRYIRHSNYGLKLTTIASDLDRADATYRMVD
ncbi:AbfB domain-containing protein [Arthrobacter sp. ISL-48]|uniref:AbfB domain-containing protein n=1 Tax=Arthrobacter sp. ISL-48 TaxID=2819110 RepID=UPI001BECCE1F|nr:AbfB domain-containing protein [Arthrobacter sp. ISL-48]MBT2533576.1 AbfB domain-containing protein [Arthrobacter sp. ISL-48]